jgi:hypothetical protein
MQGRNVKDKTVKARPIREVAADLRRALGHTQQSWATLLGWSISSAVRFENGGVPSPKMLAQMLDQADTHGLDDLAEEVRLHLNVALGPNFPINPDDEMERYFVLIARRAFQNKKRHAAFLKFAAPEIAILRAENALRKEHADRLFAGFDAAVERAKPAAKRPGKETK